jgi:hypothetical protein
MLGTGRRAHPGRLILMLLDGAGRHADDELRPPGNRRWLLSLLACAPELDPVEHVWGDLREKRFHNRVFDSLEAPEKQLEIVLADFELDASTIKSVVAWLWIIDAPLNWKSSKPAAPDEIGPNRSPDGQSTLCSRVSGKA